eukprot:COSAG06_NODE_11311_length_1530_cov_2.188679_1_plen_50_part_00
MVVLIYAIFICRWSLDPAKASLILKKFDKDKVRTQNAYAVVFILWCFGL